MTAAEFKKKWFDDPDRLRIFTFNGFVADAKFPQAALREATSDLASLSREDYAAVSAQFPPHIWNSLPAVRGGS